VKVVVSELSRLILDRGRGRGGGGKTNDRGYVLPVDRERIGAQQRAIGISSGSPGNSGAELFCCVFATSDRRSQTRTREDEGYILSSLK